MHKVKRMISAASRKILLALLVAASLNPVLAKAQSEMQKPLDIVLVHGAFADGSSWSKVIALLQKKGYRVTAVQNPLTSLEADVTATTRVIERQPHDVLLVGHSWGGAVITEAGNHPKVHGLVYLSALTPDSGESVGQLLERLHAPMEGMAPDTNGLVWLDDPAAFAKVMAGDVASQEARRLAAVQQPIAAAAFSEKIGQAAWRGKPSWYLLTEGDHALPIAVQRKLAAMTGAHTVEIRSSHMSLVSHPDAVAALIDRAARTAR
ncbi:alpha/beta fold hydrolase [Herbaspirillum sp. SJZ099]|uniref:alpha/beta fold hydrolase n=1 Tax=Herbaspirillum sp. SJZ099 TaxID=2572916 RepID=UPI0011ADA209|nr:pimeloyl-ACP methyl ester carboxylesterase [Herbaspirillum sp. SJZ099]